MASFHKPVKEVGMLHKSSIQYIIGVEEAEMEDLG